MTYPARPAPAARSHCFEQSRWRRHGLNWLMLSLTAMLLQVLPLAQVQAQEASPATVCLPPEEPFVPGSDEDFREYADVVSRDFERYFSELTAYFTCMDGTRQAVFDRARKVSNDYQTFWTRANALGVAEKAATGQERAGTVEGGN